MSAERRRILERSAAPKWRAKLENERARWLTSLGLSPTTLAPKTGTLYDRVEMLPSPRGLVMVGRWRDFIVLLPSLKEHWYDRTDVIDRPEGPRPCSAAYHPAPPWAFER